MTKDEQIMLLMEQLDIIEVFVEKDETLLSEWGHACVKGFFYSSADLIRSKDMFIGQMYDLYSKFIMFLPIHLKLEYIRFFEERTGKPWIMIEFVSNIEKYSKSKNDKDAAGWWRNESVDWLGKQ